MNYSSAYVQLWPQRLKDDNRLVIQAAAQPQKAADFILAKGSGLEESVVEDQQG